MAPEIMDEDGYETFYPDFWSLGVLLYAMLFGTVPFKANNMEELHMLIQKGDFDFPPEASKEAKSLISGLIKVDPQNRLTLPKILNHPWIKEI
jgi:serine/threonine protein kinase